MKEENGEELNIKYMVPDFMKIKIILVVKKQQKVVT